MKNVFILFLSITAFLLSGCGVLCQPTYTPSGNLAFQDLYNMPIRLLVEDPRTENAKVFFRFRVLGGHTDYFEEDTNDYVRLEPTSHEIIERSLSKALDAAGYVIAEDAPVTLNVTLRKFLAISPDTWGPRPHVVTAHINLGVEIKKVGSNLLRKSIAEHTIKKWDAFSQYEDSEVVLSSCLSNIVEKLVSDYEIVNAVKRGYGIEIPIERAKIEEGKQLPEYSERRVEPQKEAQTGTAFAISDAGHLITAYHIVKDTTEIKVRFESGDWLPATLQKYSLSNDVALLKVDQPTPVYLSFADFSTVRQGQKVFTLGYPVVNILGHEPKYSEGTISSLSGIVGEYSLIQISVPLQPGNSGGPLLTTSGDVIGMITSTAAVQAFFEHTGTLPQNVNWAVKSDYITPLLPKDYRSKIDAEGKSIDDNAVATVKQAVCFVEAK